MFRRLILLGPPGGGKGTQAGLLAEKYSLYHISTGEVLRRAVREKSELGRKVEEILSRGDLVPDELMVDIIKENLAEDRATDGFILDGFPRTVPQAQALKENGVEIDRVLFLDVPRDVLVKRLKGRRECPSCKSIINAESSSVVDDGVCPQCGEKLERREDDTEETINKRLEIYFRRTHPLIDFYRQRGLLVDVDGDQNPEMVFREICDALE